MSNILSYIESLFAPKPAIISPLAKGASFANGQPAINPPSYLQHTTPQENTWIQEQLKQNPNQTAEQLAKIYYTASTARGGINSTPSPTPTPTPAPTIQASQATSNIPQQLAPVPNDPGASYNPIIEQAAKENDIPAPLLKGVLAHESMQFNPKYVGGYHTDGSGRGVAAIDKNAHPEITDQQAFDPSFAIPWAAKTLSGYKQQEGNWYQALQRYNGGGNYNSNAPGYAGVPVIQRTRDYANNVISQAQHYGSNVSNNMNNTSQMPVPTSAPSGNSM